MSPIRVWNGSTYVKADIPRVGTSPAKEAFIWNGSAYVKVWPEKKVYIESFDANVSGGWGSNFSMSNAPAQAVCSGGRAGTSTIGSNTTASPAGYFIHNDLLTNSHYLDVSLDTPVNGTLGTDANQELLFYLRRQPQGVASDKALAIDFISPAVAIYTFSGSTSTQRAANNSAGYVSGQTMRIVMREDGFHAVYNKTTDPNLTSPLVQWTDTAKTILAYDSAHRTMMMNQETNFPFLQRQYACHSVSRLEYGDL